MRQYAVGIVVAWLAMATVACAPATTPAAPARSAAAEEPPVDDAIGRVLEAEGLLGALDRLHAGLARSRARSVDENEATEGGVSRATAGARAKGVSATAFVEPPVVTWGATSDGAGL